MIKEKIAYLKNRRKVVYEPLKAATEGVRMEYDNPLKLGDQMERLSNYLWGIDVGMGAIEDMKHDYESEMASYADDYYSDYY